MKYKSAGNGRDVYVESHNATVKWRAKAVLHRKSCGYGISSPLRPSRQEEFFFCFPQVSFWVLIIADYCLITMFDMSSKSEQMVEELSGPRKKPQTMIRKLQGANILYTTGHFQRFPLSFIRLPRPKRPARFVQLFEYALQGGQITDHMLSTEQFSEPLPRFAGERRRKKGNHEKVRNKIRELQCSPTSFHCGFQARKAKYARPWIQCKKCSD